MTHGIRPAGATLGAALLSVVVASCGSGTTRLEPRFVAVHNAMTAMGLAQTGPISEGSLPQGAEATLTQRLDGGQCYTFVALGSGQVDDIDVAVVDEQGEPLGRDLTHDRQAAAQVCPARGGEYQIVVSMRQGHGGYTVTSWSGAPVRGAGAVASSGRGPGGPGTCGQPLELAVGTPVNGDTRDAANVMQGSCARGDAPERVYQLTLESRAQVSVALESDYDGALYIVRSCGQMSTELACNDDAGSTSRSRLSATLEPGEYFLVVDGYGDASGTYEMIVSVAELRSVEAVCSDAPALQMGSPVTGSTTGTPDYFQATCAAGARSPDRVYHFDVAQRSRLRVRQQSDHDGAIYVRRECGDPNTEIACNDDFGDALHSVVTTVVDPGRYFLYSDGYRDGQEGNYTIHAELTSAAGGGAPGDDCNSAAIAPTGQPFTADTFSAADDFAGSCGGQGAADVSYRLNVTDRSRLRVTASGSEFPGVMYVRSSCADATSEVACAALPASVPSATQGVLDTVLTPGNYVLVVDGERADAFGSAEINVELTDLAALDRMCRRAPQLRTGRETRGNTTGESDDFQATCAGGAQSNDTVYRIRLTSRQRVVIDMSSDYDGALHLRRDCADASTELACNDDHGDNRHARIETTLDRGTYFLVVDGFREGSQGSYTLTMETSRP